MSAAPTDRVLSEADHEILADSGWASSRELANYAYQLGVERARVVAPLVWEPSESGGWKALNYRVISTDSGGWGAYKTDDPHFGRYAHNARDLKAACQSHHAAYVFSMLVAV